MELKILPWSSAEIAIANANNIIRKIKTVRDGSTEYTLSLPIDYIEKRVRRRVDESEENIRDDDIKSFVEIQKLAETLALDTVDFGSNPNSPNEYGLYESQTQHTRKTLKVGEEIIVNPEFIQTASVQAIEQGINKTLSHE